jgi:hypothetical protein
LKKVHQNLAVEEAIVETATEAIEIEAREAAVAKTTEVAVAAVLAVATVRNVDADSKTDQAYSIHKNAPSFLGAFFTY